MSLLQLSQLAEIIGVVAVIGSLLYVGAQLRQNTSALHAQSRQAVLTASQTELLKAVDSPELALAITKKALLTPAENMALNNWYTIVMRARMFAWLQYKDQSIDLDQWNEERLVIQLVFSSRRGRFWWQTVGRHMCIAQYAEVVDEALRERPVSDELYELMGCWSERDPDATVG